MHFLLFCALHDKEIKRFDVSEVPDDAEALTVEFNHTIYKIDVPFTTIAEMMRIGKKLRNKLWAQLLFISSKMKCIVNMTYNLPLYIIVILFIFY